MTRQLWSCWVSLVLGPFWQSLGLFFCNPQMTLSTLPKYYVLKAIHQISTQNNYNLWKHAKGQMVPFSRMYGSPLPARASPPSLQVEATTPLPSSKHSIPAREETHPMASSGASRGVLQELAGNFKGKKTSLRLCGSGRKGCVLFWYRNVLFVLSRWPESVVQHLARLLSGINLCALFWGPRHPVNWKSKKISMQKRRSRNLDT